jgi:hypothetical protein
MEEKADGEGVNTMKDTAFVRKKMVKKNYNSEVSQTEHIHPSGNG